MERGPIVESGGNRRLRRRPVKSDMAKPNSLTMLMGYIVNHDVSYCPRDVTQSQAHFVYNRDSIRLIKVKYKHGILIVIVVPLRLQHCLC